LTEPPQIPASATLVKSIGIISDECDSDGDSDSDVTASNQDVAEKDPESKNVFWMGVDEFIDWSELDAFLLRFAPVLFGDDEHDPLELGTWLFLYKTDFKSIGCPCWMDPTQRY
jgi:hypothetical protein